jgi:uncharacterized protein (UPF0248 family)
MQPIQELLHRIQWDKDFADADFKIGYYDRVEDRIILVPLPALHFPEKDHFMFELFDHDGAVHRVPFHRVREVYRDGRCIWKRPDPAH